MPEDFRPKRLLQNLEEIGERNTRILRHIEQQGVGPCWLPGRRGK
jgi:hypothetical protein